MVELYFPGEIVDYVAHPLLAELVCLQQEKLPPNLARVPKSLVVALAQIYCEFGRVFFQDLSDLFVPSTLPE